MSKKLITLCICISIASLANFALAKDVYVTKSGKTYHLEDCRLIANKDTTAIDSQEAEAENLRPCKKCFAKLEAEAEVETNKPIDIDSEDAVYITKSGSKFHKSDCKLIKNRDTSTISHEEALEVKKLTPCIRCFKEEIAKSE